jgi:hypothetical protein
LTSVELGQRGAQAALRDYLGAIDARVPDSPWADTVAWLH